MEVFSCFSRGDKWVESELGSVDFEGKIGTNMCVDRPMGTNVALCTSR